MPNPKWAKFEIDCEQYLNKHINIPNISFRRKGGSDAYDNDIYVLKDNIITSSIEAKMNSCQSGQFVVLIDDNKFVFSPNNIYDSNASSVAIINYLNRNFNNYCDVSSGGYDIPIDSSILFSWVKNHYKNNKHTNYIITGYLQGEKLIIPVDEIDNYFLISASFRRKQSGTRHLTKTTEHLAYAELEKYLYSLNNDIISRQKDNFKYEVTLKKPISNKSDLYFSFGSYLGYLSHKSNNTYYIKIRSNTNNPNVVFSLKLNKSFNDGDGLNMYIKTLL